jgi:hypothetical protein
MIDLELLKFRLKLNRHVQHPIHNRGVSRFDANFKWPLHFLKFDTCGLQIVIAAKEKLPLHKAVFDLI